MIDKHKPEHDKEDLFSYVRTPKPAPERAFDGDTYDPGRDYIRLHGLLLRVFRFMSDGRWHLLRDIALSCGGTEASCSARLRDLRKQKFGAHDVVREHLGDGLYQYRLIINRASLKFTTRFAEPEHA